MKNTYIYGLHAKGENTIMYVGCTKDPTRRLAAHLTETRRAKLGAKNKWAKALIDAGGELSMTILEECEREIAAEREAAWIEEIRIGNPELTNDKLIRPYSPHAHLNIARFRINRDKFLKLADKREWLTQSDIAQGLSVSNETVAKILSGGTVNPRTIRKISDALSTRPFDIASPVWLSKP